MQQIASQIQMQKDGWKDKDGFWSFHSARSIKGGLLLSCHSVHIFFLSTAKLAHNIRGTAPHIAPLSHRVFISNVRPPPLQSQASPNRPQIEIRPIGAIHRTTSTMRENMVYKFNYRPIFLLRKSIRNSGKGFTLSGIYAQMQIQYQNQQMIGLLDLYKK